MLQSHFVQVEGVLCSMFHASMCVCVLCVYSFIHSAMIYHRRNDRTACGGHGNKIKIGLIYGTFDFYACWQVLSIFIYLFYLFICYYYALGRYM